MSLLSRPHDVYLALGGNLGDVVTTFRRALAGLARLGRLRAVSHLYQTRALVRPGAADEADYLNAACRLHTRLTPTALWWACRRLERLAGRRRAPRWSSRTLDVDVLVYDPPQPGGPHLTLPHPRLHLRPFVVQPLMEVAPRARRLVGLGHPLLTIVSRLHDPEGGIVARHRWPESGLKWPPEP